LPIREVYRPEGKSVNLRYTGRFVSTLTLVRHGQAERFQAPRAGLSEIGERQAVALARWWLAHGISFDEIWCGALPRQSRTAAAVAETIRAAGRDWPDAVPDPAWNEYDATGALRRFGPPDLPTDPRAFQRVFEPAMHAWLETPPPADPDYEPWPAFRDRVCAGLQRILAGPPGRRVAVFTSGGPIGFTVHQALNAPPRAFLDVNWRIRNCSVTEFLFDRARLTLDAFNAVAHLDDPTLLTWR